MKRSGGGNIVLMGSDQSFIGKSNQTIYGATKAAIAQITKSLAIDYALYNIRINCVCPGTIDTPFLHRALESRKDSSYSKEDIISTLSNAQPIKRLGTPEEVAEEVCFLASNDATYVTGACYSVDGGYTAS